MSHAEHSHNGSGYEHREASLPLIVQTLIGLFITVAIVLVIVYGILSVFEKQAASEGRETQYGTAPEFGSGPHVEAYPAEELKTLRRNEDAILNRYGWVDQKNGVVHIPIDKAMDDVLSKLPTRPSQGGASAH